LESFFDKAIMRKVIKMADATISADGMDSGLRHGEPPCSADGGSRQG
jgi:hypothetical protein